MAVAEAGEVVKWVPIYLSAETEACLGVWGFVSSGHWS